MFRRKHRNPSIKTRSGLAAFLRRPAVQIGMLAVVALVVYLIAAAGSGGNVSASLPREVNVDQAYQLYQQGAFILDVREQNEWDAYHALNAALIPLGQLASRVNELAKDKKIVVVCRTSDCSQQGRDILLAAGFNATSMSGGLQEWYAKGYPIEGAPPQ